MGEGITPPKLVKRREHKNSSFMAGRTIGEKREKLETANERAAARRKDKNKKAMRFFVTTIVFLAIIGILVFLFISFTKHAKDEIQTESDTTAEIRPTIEIIDEDATPGSQITSRMREFVGQLEVDLAEYGLKATRAVVPAGSVRQINIYLDGKNGYVKTLLDRGAGVSAEDISRMLKYLESIGVGDYEYIDVRVEGKAYWK